MGKRLMADMRKSQLVAYSMVLLVACGPGEPLDHAPPGTNYVTRLEQLKRVEAGHGETVYQMRGRDHALDDLSLVITETEPGGGPDLHWHVSDEVHVVMQGAVQYIIGDSVFLVSGPSVINVPAHVPHTFMNAGDSVLHLIALFSQDDYGGYHPLGPNPLIEASRKAPAQ